jgi:hypothetical protein
MIGFMLVNCSELALFRSRNLALCDHKQWKFSYAAVTFARIVTASLSPVLSAIETGLRATGAYVNKPFGITFQDFSS